MSKDQIKDELIRSACYDERPFFGMHIHAFLAWDRWAQGMDCNTDDLRYIDSDYRTLILLCAESL